MLLWCVVSCVVVWCVCVRFGVCCVVCDTLKIQCVHSTRPRVYVQKRSRVYRHHAQTCFNMCAWCQHTQGRVEWTHGRRRGVGKCRRQSRFSSVKQAFVTSLSTLTGCSVHLFSPIFCTPKICPHTGYHVLQRFTKETLGSDIY